MEVSGHSANASLKIIHLSDVFLEQKGNGMHIYQEKNLHIWPKATYVSDVAHRPLFYV
jgi:hypothetical protein